MSLEKFREQVRGMIKAGERVVSNQAKVDILMSIVNLTIEYLNDNNGY